MPGEILTNALNSLSDDPSTVLHLAKALQDSEQRLSESDKAVADSRKQLYDLAAQSAPAQPKPKLLSEVTSNSERLWIPLITFLGNALSRSGADPGSQFASGFLGGKKEELERTNQQAQAQYQNQLAERDRLVKLAGLKVEDFEGDRRDIRAQIADLRQSLLGEKRQMGLDKDRATDNKRQAVQALNQVKFPSQVRPTAKSLNLELSEDELGAIEKDIATRNSENARDDFSRLVTQIWSNSASTGVTEANKRLLSSMRKSLAVQYGVPESVFAGVITGVTGQSERAMKTIEERQKERNQRATQFREMMEFRTKALAQTKQIAEMSAARADARNFANIAERARQFDYKVSVGYFDKERCRSAREGQKVSAKQSDGARFEACWSAGQG